MKEFQEIPTTVGSCDLSPNSRGGTHSTPGSRPGQRMVDVPPIGAGGGSAPLRVSRPRHVHVLDRRHWRSSLRSMRPGSPWQSCSWYLLVVSAPGIIPRCQRRRPPLELPTLLGPVFVTSLLRSAHDGFTAINDQFVHDAGDELLVILAKRVTGLARQTDLMARFGWAVSSSRQRSASERRYSIQQFSPIQVNSSALPIAPCSRTNAINDAQACRCDRCQLSRECEAQRCGGGRKSIGQFVDVGVAGIDLPGRE